MPNLAYLFFVFFKLMLFIDYNDTFLEASMLRSEIPLEITCLVLFNCRTLSYSETMGRRLHIQDVSVPIY